MLARITAAVLLAATLVGGSASADGTTPKKAVAAKTKKKPAKATPKATQTQPALTAEELGLGDIKLSDVKAEEQGQTTTQAAPPPAPPPPPPPPVEPPPPAPPAIEITHKDKVLVPKATPRRHLSIEVNPVPMVAGRYGGNVEFVPFVHHALTASVFYQTFTSQTLGVVMPKAVDTHAGAEARLGGEIGYRFYSGHIGANGFFAGASGVAMPLALPHVRADLHSEVVSFQTFGGAVDVGGQWVSDAGFTLGAGVGGMYLFYDAPKSATPPPGAAIPKFVEPHILPRVLLAAGWSF